MLPPIRANLFVDAGRLPSSSRAALLPLQERARCHQCISSLFEVVFYLIADIPVGGLAVLSTRRPRVR